MHKLKQNDLITWFSYSSCLYCSSLSIRSLLSCLISFSIFLCLCLQTSVHSFLKKCTHTKCRWKILCRIFFNLTGSCLIKILKILFIFLSKFCPQTPKCSLSEFTWVIPLLFIEVSQFPCFYFLVKYNFRDITYLKLCHNNALFL